jgi:DNA-binding transcriptional LysR family regulator
MTLMQLKYFSTVCSCGSVTSAANILWVSPSAVSQAIKDLETEFDLILLKRTSRGVSVTPQGELLLSYTQRILAVEEETLNAMRHLSSSFHTVRLGIPAITCDTLWPKLSSFLYKRHSDLEFQITSSKGQTELIQELKLGNLDAVILPQIAHDISPLCSKELWECPRLAFCVSEKNKLASRDYISYQDILTHPLVRLVNDGKKAYLDPIFAKYDASPNFIENCDQLSTMVGLIRNNLAGGFINTEIASHFSGIKSLIIEEEPPIHYHLLWNPKSVSHNLSQFMKIINELMTKHMTLYETSNK